MHFAPTFAAFLGSRAHLGVTGSIAAYKAADLLRRLLQNQVRVGVTLTRAGERFITPLTFQALGADPVYGEMFTDASSTFGHLQPAQDCGALVIAPATADIMAKIAHGIADDMLTSQALAFDKPLVLAPAMNPRMWRNPATQANVALLRDRGHLIVTPETGAMACGEEGEGRLADVELILLAVLKQLAPQDLTGRKILVSYGPTREFWDGVRFWSNPSSGVMGLNLAAAAWLRGAEVHVVHGPIAYDPLPLCLNHAVGSAKDMAEACLDLWPDMDAACLCAAVADMSPEPQGPDKVKKSTLGDSFAISFTATQDIAKSLGQAKQGDQKLIIFAAETHDLENQAQAKLMRKNADLVLANPVNVPGSGFDTPTNQIFAADAQGRSEHWPLLAKSEVAWRIWDWLNRL